jgi:transcriptional regulator with XRE-family HTH domain
MAERLPAVIRFHNSQVPRANVPAGNFRRMARDDTWRNTIGTWDRLKWARSRKWSTAKEAAEALGVNVNTYRAYERQPDSSKHTPLDHVHAGHFAKRMGVRWEWLLQGQGAPWADPDEDRERLLNAYDGADPGRRKAIAAAIEQLLKVG